MILGWRHGSKGRMEALMNEDRVEMCVMEGKVEMWMKG